MNERERILNLLKDGRITSDEAALLMDALEEVETPSRPRGANPSEPRGFVAPVPPVSPIPPVAPIPPIPPIAPIINAAFERAFGSITTATEELDPSLKWIRVNLSSEDLEVLVDPSLDKPSIEGGVKVFEEAGVITVTADHGARRGNGNPFSGIHWNLNFEEDDEPVIRLPEGWGLICNLSSGDLRAEGLPSIRGMVASGDVHLEAVRGVNLKVMSGDLDATLILNEGEHRLEVMSGDAQIKFVDSSVRVEGKLSSGDLDARGNFWQKRHQIQGQVGEGNAVLRVVVASGDLTLEDAHGRD